MRTAHAEALLRMMLRSALVEVLDPRPRDVRGAFDVFRTFGMVPMDDLGKRAEAEGRDGLCVRHGPAAGGRFLLELARRYAHVDRQGNRSRPRELRCSLVFEPSPALEAVGSWELWSHGLDREEFRRQVERSPGFRALVDGGHAPRSIDVATVEV